MPAARHACWSRIAVLVLALACPAMAAPPDPVLQDGVLDAFETDIRRAYQKAQEAHRAKDYLEAVRQYLVALRQRPDHARSWYNLACCYALLGRAGLAARALEKAVEVGYDDLAHLRQDPDFDSVRKDSKFLQVQRQLETQLAGLGETRLVETRMLTRCRVRLPDGYDASRTYPLVVVLHGAGGFGEDYLNVRTQLGARDVIVAAPSGPYPLGDGMDPRGPGHSWFLLSRDRNLWKRADPLAVANVLAVIEEMKRAYPVSGVYVLGHSQGAALAYLAGLEHPGLVRGILCFGGRAPVEELPAEAAARAAGQLKVFIAHGCWDVQVDVARAKASKAYLEKHGIPVTFVEFRGGHELGKDALGEAGDWIRAQEKAARPKG